MSYLLPEKTNLLRKHNPFCEYYGHNAFTFWRKDMLNQTYYEIDHFFKVNENCYHYIFLNITNTDTNKPIQYLIIDDHYQKILNRFKKGFKILECLGEEFTISIYYDSYTTKKYNNIRHFEQVIHTEYRTANILTKI